MGDSDVPSSKKPINFLRGWPNPSLLPTSAISKASQRALGDPKISNPGLLYGPDPGYQPLREEIAKWLSGFYSNCSNPSSPAAQSPVDVNPNRICITGGASQNLACVLQVFTDPLRTMVWMVAPCYFLACRIFEDAGLRTRAVGEGGGGVDLEALEKGLVETEREGRDSKVLKRPKPWSKIYRNIIYCVPTFSNPSGKSMPLLERQKLVQLARKHDALIITDDVYDFLQWPTSPKTSTSSLSKALLPRLVDIDRTLEPVPAPDSFGNAISNGSFSKIAGPGVRTGWAEATPKFTYGLSQCGSSRSGGAPSQLVATFIADLLKTGHLQTHISKVLNPAYKQRYEVMISAIQTCLLPLGVRLGEVSFGDQDVFGGYFIWLELPSGVSADVVADGAMEEENLIVAPGRIFEVRGDESVKFENSLRLCFSWEELQDLEEGVERLGRVVKGLQSARGRVVKEMISYQKGGNRDLGDFQ